MFLWSNVYSLSAQPKKITQILNSDDEKSIPRKRALESSLNSDEESQHKSKKASTETQHRKRSDAVSVDGTNGSEDDLEPEMNENQEGAKNKVCIVQVLMMADITNKHDNKQGWAAAQGPNKGSSSMRKRGARQPS